MKRYLGGKRAWLLVLVLVISLCLTACGGIMTGKMEMDSAFRGSRTITCSVKLNELERAVEGGVDTIHAIVSDNCPKALKYRFTVAAGDLTYFFTLNFTDAKSYQNLILSILPDSKMELTVGDGRFSNGIRLKEDFTDRDLMQWFDDALFKSGKYQAEDTPIWEQTSCSLVVDGVTVSNYQPFSYDTYQGVTLSDVTVYTTVLDNGNLQRVCRFEMASDAYETAGDQFAKYLAGRMPEGAESVIDTEKEGITAHELRFTAVDADELGVMTAQLFGDRGLFAAMSEPTSAYSNKITYSEYLSFEEFPADSYHYYVKSGDASENAGLSDGYGSAILLGEWLSYPVEGGELSVAYTRHKSFAVNDIEVLFYYALDGLEAVTVHQNFTGLAAAANAKTAADWYDALTAGKYPPPQLIQTENGVTCSAYLQREDASLQCLESWFGVSRMSDAEMENRLFSDRVNLLLDCDFTALMAQSKAKKITTTLMLPQGMHFISVRQDGNSVRCEGNAYTLWNQSFTLSAKARVLRTDRIILAALIGAFSLIVALICAAAGIRLHLGRKGGKENETFLLAMKQSIKAIFTGSMPRGADKEGVRYFYGKRGPQALILLGAVIVPLVWAIVYLICYEKANAFYFFSGFLRYLSVTLLVLCALTVPVAFVWRYYQKASDENEVGLRMAEKTAELAKTQIAQNHNRILSESKELPLFDTALMVPDAFTYRASLSKRLLCRLVRQFSRKFPDIERPVCVYLPGDKIAASRSVVQNIMLIDGKLIFTASLVNPAFATVKELLPTVLPIAQVQRFSREDTVLHVCYRDGMLIRRKRVVFTKATITTDQKQKVSFVLPKSAKTTAELESLSALLRREKA